MNFASPEVETQFLRMQPEAREAAFDLDAFAREQGWDGLTLLAVEETQPWPTWGPFGCTWRARLTHSRRAREALLARLRKGRRQLTWDILMPAVDEVVCLRRDFAFRCSRGG